MMVNRPPAGRAWWRRLRSAFKPRRIVQIGLLGALTFLVAYVDPQTALQRAIWALVAAALVFTQAPVLFGRQRYRLDPRWRRGDAASEPATPPGTVYKRGWRSRVRQRWPRLSGRLPGFRPRRPADLPERIPTFRGRRAELDEVESAIRARSEWAPVVLIHGMPGVGKSALARECAHRLADRFPHGQLYANLGSGGADRPAGEVLKEFLLALGWPEEEIPGDTESRGKIYRSLTRHRRILVVLDAARDHSQVRELLPNGRRQAVIVTSRRDLGPELGAVAMTLTPPSTRDALAIVRAVTDTPDGDAPVHAVAIVRRCGRLPRALRAASSRVLAARRQLRDVARRMWEDIDLLDYLAYDGVNLSADFDAEYRRLLPRDQQALRLLTLIESPTFVPWVLCPLLGVDLLEAENLVTRLGAAHLLEVAGPGTTSGTARYSFHPLVRQFALAKRDAVDSHSTTAHALARVHAAYRDVVQEILNRIGEPVPRVTSHESQWLPLDFDLDRIAQNPEWWVRAEHANLVRCASRAAQSQEWGLCWRIARWLGGCIPLGCDPAVIASALEASEVAANQENSAEGLVGVRLATAGLLAATGRHADAGQLIASTVELAAARRLPALAAVGQRRYAEALLHIGAYTSAAGALRNARRFAEQVPPAADPAFVATLDGSGERLLIDLLEHSCTGFREPPRWRDDPPDIPLPAWHDSGRFHAHLARAEAAWRGGHWDLAFDELARALEANRDDSCRVGTIEYHQARLCLMRARAATIPARQLDDAARAVERAADALLTFRDIRNRVGELRARCLLTRGLVAAGWLDEGARQAEKAYSALRGVASAAGDAAGELLHAAVDHANGETRLARGGTLIPHKHTPRSLDRQSGGRDSSLAEAIRMFQDAGAVYRSHGDWWTAAECDLGLGRAYRRHGHQSDAMAALWQAIASFGRAHDLTGRHQAVQELIATATDMGHHHTVRDLRRLLPSR